MRRGKGKARWKAEVVKARGQHFPAEFKPSARNVATLKERKGNHIWNPQCHRFSHGCDKLPCRDSECLVQVPGNVRDEYGDEADGSANQRSDRTHEPGDQHACGEVEYGL